MPNDETKFITVLGGKSNLNFPDSQVYDMSAFLKKYMKYRDDLNANLTKDNFNAEKFLTDLPKCEVLIIRKTDFRNWEMLFEQQGRAMFRLLKAVFRKWNYEKVIFVFDNCRKTDWAYVCCLELSDIVATKSPFWKNLLSNPEVFEEYGEKVLLRNLSEL